MLEVTVIIHDNESNITGKHTARIPIMMVSELEFLTMSSIAIKTNRPVTSWALQDMARLYCTCSSAGVDLFLAEYGKKRLEEKRKEARKLVIEGP